MYLISWSVSDLMNLGFVLSILAILASCILKEVDGGLPLGGGGFMSGGGFMRLLILG